MADVTSEEEARRKREREWALLLALFLLLVDDTDAHLRAQVTLYLAGSVSIHSLSRNLTGALIGAHAHAVWMGRRLAGVTAPLNETDMQFAQTVMHGQSKYLTGLLNDLRTTRYPVGEDGEMNGSLANRLLLYARGLRATAQEAWVLGLPPTTRVYWRLGTEPEHHCTVCPELAAAGPYDAHNMPTVPGAGATPCLASCYCYLETEDGQRCFTL